MILTDLPDLPLQMIYDKVVAGSHTKTHANYRWFFNCNKILNPSLAKMTLKCGNIAPLLFRLVCRRFREIANNRPITIDLLLNNCDARFMRSKLAGMSYPFDRRSKEFLDESYWDDIRQHAGPALPPSGELVRYWKQEVKLTYRLIASNFSTLVKVNPGNCAGKIGNVLVGGSGTHPRAIHVWRETGYNFLKDLKVPNLHIGALRLAASDEMRLLSSTKNAASLAEMKESFRVTCDKLIYVVESSYRGNGSDFHVHVPDHPCGVILTSGINGIQFHNRRTLFREDWDFSNLPSPDATEKGYTNIRATEELAMQYVFVQSFQKLMQFFPRLKRVTLWKGCYLRELTTSVRATQTELSIRLCSAFLANNIVVEMRDETSFVY